MKNFIYNSEKSNVMRNKNIVLISVFIILGSIVIPVANAQLTDDTDDVKPQDVWASTFPEGDYNCPFTGPFTDSSHKQLNPSMLTPNPVSTAETCGLTGGTPVGGSCTYVSCNDITTSLGTCNDGEGDIPCRIEAHGVISTGTERIAVGLESLSASLSTNSDFNNVNIADAHYWGSGGSTNRIDDSTFVKATFKGTSENRIKNTVIGSDGALFSDNSKNDVTATTFEGPVTVSRSSNTKFTNADFASLEINTGPSVQIISSNSVNGNSIPFLKIISGLESRIVATGLKQGYQNSANITPIYGLESLPGTSGNPVGFKSIDKTSPYIKLEDTEIQSLVFEAKEDSVNLFKTSSLGKVSTEDESHVIFDDSTVQELRLDGSSSVEFKDITDSALTALQAQVGLDVEQTIEDHSGTNAPLENPTVIQNLIVESASNVQMEGNVKINSYSLNGKVDRAIPIFVRRFEETTPIPNVVENQPGLVPVEGAEVCVYNPSGDQIGDCKTTDATGYVETDLIEFDSSKDSGYYTYEITKIDPVTQEEITLSSGDLNFITEPTLEVELDLPITPGFVDMDVPNPESVDSHKKIKVTLEDRSTNENQWVVYFGVVGVDGNLISLPNPQVVSSKSQSSTGVVTFEVGVPQSSPNYPVSLAVAAKSADSGQSDSVLGVNKAGSSTANPNYGTNTIHTLAKKSTLNEPTTLATTESTITYDWLNDPENPSTVSYRIDLNNGDSSPTLSETSTHTFTGLTPNTEYSAQVYAINNDNVGVVSNTIDRYTKAAIPNNKGSSSNIDSAQLTWNNNGNPQGTIYRIHKWNTVSQTVEADGQKYTITQPTTENPVSSFETDDTSQQLTALECAKAFYYSIHSINEETPKEYSSDHTESGLGEDPVGFATLPDVIESDTETSASPNGFTNENVIEFTLNACADYYSSLWNKNPDDTPLTSQRDCEIVSSVPHSGDDYSTDTIKCEADSDGSWYLHLTPRSPFPFDSINFNLGDSGTLHLGPFIIDTTPPETSTSSPFGPEEYASSDFDLDVQDCDGGVCNENAQQRLDECRYTVVNTLIEDGETVEQKTVDNELRTCGSVPTITVGPNADCKNEGLNACTIELYAVDEAGNQGDEEEITINVDYTSPVTTDNSEEQISSSWTDSNPTISLTCDDGSTTETTSGCSSTAYCVTNHGTSCTPSQAYQQTGASFACQDGSHCQQTMIYKSEDNAGNNENPHGISFSGPVKIDLAAPVKGAISSLDASEQKSITVNVSQGQDVDASGNSGSGIANNIVNIYDNSGNLVKSETIPAKQLTYTFTDLSPNTEYIVKVQYEDNVGHLGDLSFGKSIFTLAAPADVNINDVSESSLSVSIEDDENPSGTEYALEFDEVRQVIDGNEWNGLESWNNYQVSDLIPNTEHDFRVVTRNGAVNPQETLGELIDRYTYAATPPQFDISVSDDVNDETPVRLDWGTSNPNPDYTRYDIYRKKTTENSFGDPIVEDHQDTFLDDDPSGLDQPNIDYIYRVIAKNNEDPPEEAAPVDQITNVGTEWLLTSNEDFDSGVRPEQAGIETGYYELNNIEIVNGALRLKDGALTGTAIYSFNPLQERIIWVSHRSDHIGSVEFYWSTMSSLDPVPSAECQDFNKCANDDTDMLIQKIVLTRDTITDPSPVLRSSNVKYV